MEPTNYIYLVKEREFIKTNENIYKIGRSKQENTKRFLQYPKGSELILQEVCIDCIKTEKMIINEFKKHFIHRKDIGNEYFEGDYLKMRKIVWGYILDESNQVENDNCNESLENIQSPQNEIFEDIIDNLTENKLKKNIDIYVNYYIKNFDKELEIIINEKELLNIKKKEFQNNIDIILKEHQEVRKQIEESIKENEEIVKQIEKSKKENEEIMQKINNFLRIKELEKEINHIKNKKIDYKKSK
jgi:hypothetical protein